MTFKHIKVSFAAATTTAVELEEFIPFFFFVVGMNSLYIFGSVVYIHVDIEQCCSVCNTY